jgi:site-specific DNA recombinase
MLAAQYARYSTDNQRRTSIEDQLRQGAEVGAREGLQLAPEFVYSDEETSASLPVKSRPGSARLMRDALAGRFHVLIIEALDRFSRNLVDQEEMVQELEHLGIRLIGYADGYDSRLEGREMFRQVRGSFNEQQLRDIGKKTHRGLDGQVERGYHAGGISYGYTSTVAGVDGKGEPIGHHLVVDEAAAAHVRWIFERFADGWSCQAIAADLNRRGVRAPRGKTWAVSAIYGSPRKGSGVLNNEVYIGRYIWNRSRWRKHPKTKRRERIERPREEWKISERPQLAIVPPALWAQVRARMDRPRIAGGTRGRGQAPRTLFGGLLSCGACGGAVVAVNARTYGCAARKDRGAVVCAGVLVSRAQLEARLLSLVREELLAPEALVALQAEVARILTERRRARVSSESSTRARLADLAREIGNLVDAVANAGMSLALKARLQAAEREQERLRTATAPEPTLSAIPAVLSAYKGMVLNLQQCLGRDVPRARTLLQGLLGVVRLDKAPDGVYAEVETSAERLFMAAGVSLGVVAGTRFGSRKRIRVR